MGDFLEDVIPSYEDFQGLGKFSPEFFISVSLIQMLFYMEVSSYKLVKCVRVHCNVYHMIF